MWNPVQMGFFPETFCLVEFVFVQGFCLFGVWVLLGVFCLVLFVCLLFLLLFVYFGVVFFGVGDGGCVFLGFVLFVDTNLFFPAFCPEPGG